MVAILFSGVKMTAEQRRKLDRMETVALFVITGVLLVLLIRSTGPNGITCPRIFQVTVDTKGNCRLGGLPLSNAVLRRALFRWIAVSGGEVDINLFPGWARNPIIKNNVMTVNNDIERFGLSAGDRVLARRKKMEHNE